jgi:hypothetical protein
MPDFILQYRWLIGGLVLAALLVAWLAWAASRPAQSGKPGFKLAYLLFWPYFLDRRRQAQQGTGGKLLTTREIVVILILVVVAIVAIILTPGRGT